MARTGYAAMITLQPGADKCDEPVCDTSELFALVEADNTEEVGVFCPIHRAAFLLKVTDQ